MPGIPDLPPVPLDLREPYGPDKHQFADLRVPPGAGPFPVVRVIHGGFWRAAYDLEHAGHLRAVLKRAAWQPGAWNIA